MNRLLPAAAAVSLLAATSLVAQTRPRPDLVPTVTSDRRPVLYDTDTDGRLFALGKDWKMEFSAEGASFAPRLGAHVPHRMPLRFVPPADDRAAPRRDGDRVRFHRQGYDEVYDLHPGHVEQSFLLSSPPQAPALVLPVATGLACTGHDRDGLVFAAGDAGGVHYGDACAIDARGDRVALPVWFERGAIHVPLPAAWFASAAYPVCIDPILQTFGIDGSDPAEDPAVAYSDTANVFQVSYVFASAADDHDILATRFTADGVELETLAIDVTTKDSIRPDVEFSSPHFLTAWQNSAAGSGGASVEARARVAGSTGISTKFRVDGTIGVPSYPVVAGGANGQFLVAWGAIGFPARPDLKARLVSAGGTQSGVINVYSSPLFGIDYTIEPAISPVPDSAGRWLIAFERGSDIYGVQVTTAGAVLGSVFTIAASPTMDEIEVDVATIGSAFFVAYENVDAALHRDIRGRRIVGGTAPALGGVANLSTLQPNVSGALSQIHPQLSFDGVRLALVYLESTLLYGATFFPTTTVTFQEGHVLIDATPNAFRFDPAIAGAGLDVRGRHFVALRREDQTTRIGDIQGALWTTLASGGVTRLDTGCGGTGVEPIVLSASVPALGSNIGVTFVGFHALLVAVGTPSVLAACPNTSCQIGVGNATFTTGPANGVLNLAIGTSVSLLGTQIAVQGLDFLPPANATEACTSTTNTFTTSDTLVFTVQ